VSGINIGIDGVSRRAADDLIISRDIEALFQSPVGAKVLTYLKSITINMVSGPEISDSGLRHLEGQRFIVAIIERRIQHAKRKKTK